MMRWTRQGPALTAAVLLSDGSYGKAVLMASRENPKGAMLVLSPADGGPVKTLPLSEGLTLLSPDQVIDILCAQERAFGAGHLPSLESA